MIISPGKNVGRLFKICGSLIKLKEGI